MAISCTVIERSALRQNTSIDSQVLELEYKQRNEGTWVSRSVRHYDGIRIERGECRVPGFFCILDRHRQWLLLDLLDRGKGGVEW